MMSQEMLRRYSAEFIGALAYVFFGCGVRILQVIGQDAGNRLLIYLTFGFTLFIMTYDLNRFHKE